MEFQICEECFNDEVIKSIIQKKNQRGICVCCKKENVSVIADDEIQSNIAPYCQLYMAYHYDEWQYNDHSGGDLMELVKSENIFCDWSKLDDFFDVIFDSMFSENCGYMYSNENFSPAIKNIHCFSNHRFFYENEILSKQMDLVSEIFDDVENFVEKKEMPSVLYRARMGYDSNAKDSCFIEPYKGKDIGAAPSNICSNGRANRSFVSFLYLAKDVKTAIHEIRPTKGDLVSVGTFKRKKDLKIFNLAFPDILKCTKINYIDAFKTLQNVGFLNYLFSRPTGSADKHFYLPTQLFTEKIISKKYDGICFRSSFTDGLNYVIFDPSLFNFQSSKLYEISAIECDFEEYNPNKL